jgi:outer membrane protein assembly factor BamB
MNAISRTLKTHVRPAFPALGLALFLVACAADEKPKLDGERISVLNFERALAVDPRVSEQAITLPPVFRNNEWPNPGGYASHAAYHVALDGNKGAFKVDAVSGNTNDLRLKSPPVIGGGKVFALGAELDVSALDAKTGKIIWQRSVAAEDTKPNTGLTRFVGIRERAVEIEDGFGGGLAYDNGRVFVTSGFGEIIALSAETGDVIWKIRNTVPFSNAPTIRAGRLYAVSRDSRLQVVSTEDGSRLWEHLAITELATVIGATSPAVDSRMVVAGFNSGEIVALNSINGRVAWSDSLTSRATQITPLSELNAIVGRPVIDGDRVFAVSHGGRMVSIDMRTGERIWTTDIGSIETPWVLGDFIFVITLDGQLVCLSSAQGRVRWVSQLPAFEDPDDREGRINWTGPVLASGKVYVASSTGEMLALDPANGEITERADLGEPVNVPPVVADGTIYFLTDDGTLIARR